MTYEGFASFKDTLRHNLGHETFTMDCGIGSLKIAFPYGRQDGWVLPVRNKTSGTWMKLGPKNLAFAYWLAFVDTTHTYAREELKLPSLEKVAAKILERLNEDRVRKTLEE